MKKSLLILILMLLPFAVFSKDKDYGTKYGIQMSSDSMFGFLVYSGKFEIGLKGQLKLYDYDEEGKGDPNLASLGLHGGYLFNLSDSKTDISVGADIRSSFGIGDLDYEQYIDAFPRLAFNYRLGEHFLLSGILHIFHINVIQTEAENSFALTATLPETAVAVSYLF